MATPTKPILHNGFKIKDGLTVKNRVERIFFTEVYVLSDESFLYLFLNLNPNEVIDRREKYEHIRVKRDNEELPGVIVKEHSSTQLSAVIEDLTTIRGFDSIAGMHDLKQLLVAEVINPLKNPEKFKRFKVSIPNGIILYGPPGVGKSFIVRKLAEELGYNYVEVKGSDLATPFIHGSVGNIGKVFDMAKQNAPTILCFNEISALVPDRKNLHDSSSHKEEETSEFLTQLEEAADNKVLVIGTTNFLERIDEAVIRPGRFDKKIYVPPPDFEARKEIFKLALSGRPYDKSIDFDKLASITENYSSAEIVEGIIETAARIAANLDKPSIDQDLLEAEIKKLKPVV
jgi:transitional endoplasmic reticulum ATPase